MYGFRKVKEQNILISDDHDEDQSKWWRFKHENFRRGRPDLLHEMKKSNQVVAADQQDVDNLKQEVSYLRAEMGKLSAVVQQMFGMLHQVTGRDPSVAEPSNKKRKFVADFASSIPVEVVSTQLFEPSLTGCDDAIHPERASDADLLLEDIPVEYQSGSVSPLREKVKRSVSSEFVESMFDFVKDDSTASDNGSVDPSYSTSPQPDSANSCSIYNRSVSHSDDSHQTNQLDPELSAKLENAVSMLPKSLQESFVERIVEKIASPEAYQKHVDAVSVLATAAAIEAQNQTMRSNAPYNASRIDGSEHTRQLSMKNQSDTTLPVAAACLGAFLAKYSNAPAPGDGKAPPRYPATADH